MNSEVEDRICTVVGECDVADEVAHIVIMRW